MATTSAPGTEFSDSLSAGFEDGGELPPGIGPWKLAMRRLRRNKVALFFGGLFLLIVVLCLLAPLSATLLARGGPAEGNITGTIKVGNKTENIVSFSGIPIGPTWHSRYFLGADGN